MEPLVKVDYRKLTLREQKELCELGEVPNLQAFHQRLAESDPTCLAAIVTMVMRQIDASFTMEDAWDMNEDQIRGLFENIAPNAQGAGGEGSTTSTSVPSAPSTTTRQASSGRSHRKN